MFNILDVIFLVIIAVIALFATAKGFLNEIFNKASWILSILFGVLFYGKLNPYVIKTIKYEWLAKILSFLLIFIVVFLFIKILQTIISKIFSGEILKGLDRALGFFLGLVEGLALVFLLVFILYVQPWFPTDTLFNGSFFFKLFGGILPAVSERLNGVGVV